MLNRKIDLRETVGMMLCILLSLAAFFALLLLLAYSEGDRLVAALAFLVSLACPVVWMIFLLRQDGGGGGLVHRVRRKVNSPRLRPVMQRKGRPAGTLVEG